MNLFTKSLLSSLMATLLIINAPLYGHGTEIKRSIEIKAEQGKDVTIYVDENDHQHSIILSAEEMADLALLEEKLQILEGETLAKVKVALEQVRGALKNANRSIRIEHDDFELADQLAELETLCAALDEIHLREFEYRFHHFEDDEIFHDFKPSSDKLIIIDGRNSKVIELGEEPFSQAVDGDKNVERIRLEQEGTVLKGHVDAILKMIKHGKFSVDELDKLQQAIDSKRKVACTIEKDCT